jgi:hypothetical protein
LRISSCLRSSSSRLRWTLVFDLSLGLITSGLDVWPRGSAFCAGCCGAWDAASALRGTACCLVDEAGSGCACRAGVFAAGLGGATCFAGAALGCADR